MTGDSSPGLAGVVIAGRYQNLRPLGAGGFGRTFLADDSHAGRPVAIKLLDPRSNADWKARELFEREAKVLGLLRHQGVPEVYDFLRDSWEGVPADFLVMQYIDGVSLQQLIDRSDRLDSAAAFTLFLEMLGILEYLHTRIPPVLHRDIKPANIVLTREGRPILVDFGSVRHLFHDPGDAGSTIAGTYGYMPYEQYMGQATARSDLYALGATYLHLITGRAPREFLSDDGALSVPDQLPGDMRVAPVVAKMLSASPADRFASAREVRDRLLAPTGAGSAISAVARPVPRDIARSEVELLRRIAPTAFEYMDPDAKPGDTASLFDWVALGFVSVLTLGAYPLVFYNSARSRRRRAIPFLRDGVSGTGIVLNIRIEKAAFDSRLARVSYQFSADDTEHRDSDLLLTSVADKLAIGDTGRIRYLPEREYDSIIVP